jgi:hypothetical protein
LITEIEAHGTEEVSERGKVSDDSQRFDQRLGFSANTPLLKTLNVAVYFSVDRRDENPDSILNSFTGIFKNIFTKSEREGDEDFKSNVTRAFGVSTNWKAHEHITASLSYNRGESFDNTKETDARNDTYSLSFSSDPLPTLRTNLSLSRSENRNFGEKSSASNSMVLSVDSELYKYINMTTDMSYSLSESFAADTESKAYAINGSIDAVFTKKLFASLKYNFSWSSSETETTSARNGSTRITYRLGRFFNIWAGFRISDSEESRTTSENISINWIPLPAIRLNIGYQHSVTTPDSSRSDSFNSSGSWEITKFMYASFSYTYDQRKDENEKSSQSISANLSCRF